MKVERLPAYGMICFALAGLLLVLLTGCTTDGRVDSCKYAGMRRAMYQTTITGIDAYILSGRPAPQEMMFGRQTAVVALTVLNARCPLP